MEKRNTACFNCRFVFVVFQLLQFRLFCIIVISPQILRLLLKGGPLSTKVAVVVTISGRMVLVRALGGITDSVSADWLRKLYQGPKKND